MRAADERLDAKKITEKKTFTYHVRTLKFNAVNFRYRLVALNKGNLSNFIRRTRDTTLRDF